MSIDRNTLITAAGLIAAAAILGLSICHAASTLSRSLASGSSTPVSSVSTPDSVRLVFPQSINLVVSADISGTHKIIPAGVFSIAGPSTRKWGKDDNSIPVRMEVGNLGGADPKFGDETDYSRFYMDARSWSPALR
jgi:hypothetical protein